jgi:hypothetical protein
MKLTTIVSNVLVAATVWSGAANAELLTLKAGANNKESVNISTGATANVDGANYDLTTVGSGLRKKKVVIVPIKVYVAQLLVNDQARYVKTDAGALPSIDNQTTIAIHLTFLRDVPASNIKESFQVSLDANGVPSNDADIVKFMSLVDEAGAATTNGSLTIVVNKAADGSESLALENKGSSSVLKTMKGGKGLAHKIASIWLGVPADDYLKELKAELLQ